ncbi:hypothetical protein Y1Q_0024457 [Alligator mississippiensis]|uniref:Uncharacterized protein n=1 Tax=Alligator mississippiensis TaxID=8496 RepID=A0A151N833_ALLMI|nr:hypothetical protein Y1Q_0024457 [Alligator mississippiensis]
MIIRVRPHPGGKRKNFTSVRYQKLLQCSVELTYAGRSRFSHHSEQTLQSTESSRSPNMGDEDHLPAIPCHRVSSELPLSVQSLLNERNRLAANGELDNATRQCFNHAIQLLNVQSNRIQDNTTLVLDYGMVSEKQFVSGTRENEIVVYCGDDDMICHTIKVVGWRSWLAQKFSQAPSQILAVIMNILRLWFQRPQRGHQPLPM